MIQDDLDAEYHEYYSLVCQECDRLRIDCECEDE